MLAAGRARIGSCCPPLLLTAATATAAPPALDPRALHEAWPRERFVKTAAPCFKHLQLFERLQALAQKHQDQLKLEEAGRSFEGRSIHLLTLGSGPKRVLLWSQMHGDEPSATPALLDLADWLLSHRAEPGPQAILEGTTLYLVPMLNPDGAERYERRNAQAIDVNRDALSLSTPEGPCSNRCATASSPSWASTCTTRTAARRWASRGGGPRSRCWRWPATSRAAR